MKLKFIFAFLISILLVTDALKAQNKNSIWCFGDSAGINFSNINNPVPFTSSVEGRGSCVSIADNNGNLLFYSNTYMNMARTMVWNALNDTMTNSYPMGGGGAYYEIQIVPFPDGQNKYYLFYHNMTGFIDGIFYAIIDMNTVWGTPSLGEVIIKGQQINTNRIADCFQAVKHGNGRDWWLVTKMSSDNLTSINRFIEYLITPSGIAGPFHFDFGGALDQDFQKIVFNTSCSKIMNINTMGYMCEYDFDRCSGVISNPHVIYPAITSPPNNRVFWEGAYSPNDSVFYISTSRSFGVNYAYLLQYDLTAFDIPASCDTLDSATVPIGTGAVRLAPDGKIYYSRAYESPGVNSFPYKDTMYNYINMNLSVINEPDNLGAACNYQPFSFYLGGKRTYYGLPNNPNYDLGALAGSVCDTITGIAPFPLENPDSYREGVTVMPNPAKEKVRFEYSEPVTENSQIEVYDNLGVMVKKIILTKGSISTTFSINDLPPGVYSCRVSINNVFKQVDKLTIIR